MAIYTLEKGSIAVIPEKIVIDLCVLMTIETMSRTINNFPSMAGIILISQKDMVDGLRNRFEIDATPEEMETLWPAINEKYEKLSFGVPMLKS